MATNPAILVVDDELRSREALRRTLDEEFVVHDAAGADEALAVLERETVAVVLCDQRMPGTTGIALLKQMRVRWPDIIRIVLSGYTDTEDIIAGINEAGIYQYLLKPWQPDSLRLAVRAAAELHRLQHLHQRLHVDLRSAEPVVRARVEARRREVKRAFDLDRIVRAPGSPMNALCAMVERIAPYDLSVLVTGESGTGKELLARAMHFRSARADRAFVVENCGALPDQLLESELFGHKRGSFTGAYEDRIGLFQQADGGTIFLDEIGETSPAFQVKLLRVLQEGEIRAVGGARTVSVDVRVVSATNRDLEADVRSGRFRKDLYYRLSTVKLHVPPLRDRPDDIAPLARQVLERAMTQLGKTVRGFTAEAMDRLVSYPWPGNVRELQNEIQRMLALCDGEWVGAELFAGRDPLAAPATPAAAAADDDLRTRLDALEARVIEEAMRRHRGNKTRVADELGLSRVGLRAKLARYGIGRDRGGDA
ncbi:MAG: sigma-54-dependent Fis family transcriptional regulator [Burkholderiales bacterium]|nr:sigma-54-dependent Fis family transcriptional regulator [Burkholderiales bacterium]